MGEDTREDRDEVGLVECQEQPVVGLRQVVPMDRLPEVFGRALPVVVDAVRRAGLVLAGPPYARYRGTPTETVDVEVGLPVESHPGADVLDIEAPAGSRVTDEPLPAVRAAETVHAGAYDDLGRTYARVADWVHQHGLEALDESWELYESGPDSDPDPATWRTRVLVAVSGRPIEPPPGDRRG